MKYFRWWKQSGDYRSIGCHFDYSTHLEGKYHGYGLRLMLWWYAIALTIWKKPHHV